MDEILRDIEGLKARWMTGGSAIGQAPKAWQGVDELGLLALTGQFSRIALRPATAPDTTQRPDIPALALQPMPEELRPQFRRILENKLAGATDVVRLIAHRGYCVNPIDWMPKRTEANLPPVYEVWRDWLDGNLPPEVEQGLSAETWETTAPGHRYQMLMQMHRETPEKARALITAVAPSVAADQRLRMLQCLRPALTLDDKELLQGFAADRSSKVQTLVKTQLARLGTGPETDAEAAAEITDYVEVAKAGLLSRKRVVRPKKMKTSAQKKRRAQVFAKVSLAGLAAALGVSADDVVESWTFAEGTQDLERLVAESGTDAQVERLLERAIEERVHPAPALIERLDAEARQRFGLLQLPMDDASLKITREWITEPSGNVDWNTLSTFKALSELIKTIVEPPNTADDARASEALAFLALLADQAAATTLLEKLTGAGVMAVDPRLTLLRLNAAL